MNCPKCNAPIPPNALFCGECGTPVAQTPEQPAPVMPEQPAPVMPEQPAPYMPEQPAPYTPEPQPAPQPQVSAPEYAAPQNTRDFKAQYQQYQQPSPYGSSQPQYGGQPPKGGSKTPLIIVIIVLAVLLIGGGVFLTIFLLNNNNGDNNNGGNSSDLSSLVVSLPSMFSSDDIESSNDIESSREIESSRDIESSSYIESSRDIESSSYIESSRDIESSSYIESSRDIESGGITFTMDEIVELMKPSAESASNDNMNVEVYAEGDDTLVFEYTYKDDIEDSKKSLYKETLEKEMDKDTVADTMESSKEMIATASGRDIKIKMIYLTNDGDVLAERTY